MKAKYEKPVLEVVQLNVNSAIASCSESYFDLSEVNNCKKLNDMITEGYFSDNSCDIIYEDKCYFTATSAFSS